MFNQAGFNSLQFNQQVGDYQVSRDDSLEVVLVEETIQQVQMSSHDDININISEAQVLVVNWEVADSWAVYFVEGVDLYAETSGTDPPIVFIEEHAEVHISVSDELKCTFDMEVPLGFNQQQFNQPPKTTIVETEQAVVGISQSDEIGVVLEESVDQQNAISASDALFVYVDQSRRIYKEMFVNDELAVGLTESYELHVELEIEDSIVVDFQDIPAQIEIDSSDNLVVAVDGIKTRITGTLSYLIDGKFHMITKGYVKVNQQFKPIVKEYAIVGGEWKIRK